MNEESKKIFIEQRLKEIEEETDKLDKIIEEKEKNWDYSTDFSTENYRKFLKHLEPEQIRLAQLDRERRKIMPYELSKLSNIGHVMTLKEFIKCVKAGGFIDYDGFGRYVKDGQETNITIYPSDINYGAVRKEFDTIVWYNR
jgi:hypothetical protein